MTPIRTGTCVTIILFLCCRAHAEGVSFETALRKHFDCAVHDTTEIDTSVRDRIKLKEDLRLIGIEEVAGEKRWEQKKVPRVAVLSTMVLPGLGQLYNGRRLKVAIMVGMNTFYLGKAWIHYKRSVIRKTMRDQYPPRTSTWFFHNSWYEFHKESAKDYIWWWGAVWLVGMLDAYIDAQLFDLRGYVPENGKSQSSYLTMSMSF